MLLFTRSRRYLFIVLYNQSSCVMEQADTIGVAPTPRPSKEESVFIIEILVSYFTIKIISSPACIFYKGHTLDNNDVSLFKRRMNVLRDDVLHTLRAR